MYNLQANGLNKALLLSDIRKRYMVAFEPLMIKKSECKQLEVGSRIVLGKALPKLYIYRKGDVVGQVNLGQVEGVERLIISAEERISNLGKPDSKCVLLECRLAILSKEDVVVGKLVSIPKGSIHHIQIFSKGKPLAAADLVQDGGALSLLVKELY